MEVSTKRRFDRSIEEYCGNDVDFKEFMYQVDECVQRFGFGVMDLPDYAFGDAFYHGVSPVDAAQECLQEAGYEEGYEEE